MVIWTCLSVVVNCPKRWPYPTTSFILANDGSGNFSVIDADVLSDFGMVTDAVWVNLDDDEQLELVTWRRMDAYNGPGSGKRNNDRQDRGFRP